MKNIALIGMPGSGKTTFGKGEYDGSPKLVGQMIWNLKHQIHVGGIDLVRGTALISPCRAIHQEIANIADTLNGKNFFTIGILLDVIHSNNIHFISVS